MLVGGKAKQSSCKQLSNPGFGMRLEAVRGQYDNSAKADLPAPGTLSDQWKKGKGLGANHPTKYKQDAAQRGQVEGLLRAPQAATIRSISPKYI